MVSLIIPIYNVEKELARCLDSILAQSYSQWEAILVDDGSSDSSADICNTYCAQSSRFKYIKQVNQGVAIARRVGVESATGEYIIFVDSDDSLPPKAIEALLEQMGKSVDIVASSYNIHKSNRKVYRGLQPKEMSGKEWTKELLLDIAPHEPWAKIYRRSLFTSKSFPQIRCGEDWLLNIEVASRCRAVKYIDQPCYNYFHREESVMRSYRYSVRSSEAFCRATLNLMQECGIYERYRDEYTRLSLNQIFIALTKGSHVSIKDSWIEKVCNDSQSLRLSFREQIAIVAIKNIIIQRSLQITARLYRLFA